MITLIGLEQKNDSSFEIVLKVNNRQQKHLVELNGDRIHVMQVEEDFRPLLTANPEVPKTLITLIEKSLRGEKIRLPQRLPESQEEWTKVA